MTSIVKLEPMDDRDLQLSSPAIGTRQPLGGSPQRPIGLSSGPQFQLHQTVTRSPTKTTRRQDLFRPIGPDPSLGSIPNLEISSNYHRAPLLSPTNHQQTDQSKTRSRPTLSNALSLSSPEHVNVNPPPSNRASLLGDNDDDDDEDLGPPPTLRSMEKKYATPAKLDFLDRPRASPSTPHSPVSSVEQRRRERREFFQSVSRLSARKPSREPDISHGSPDRFNQRRHEPHRRKLDFNDGEESSGKSSKMNEANERANDLETDPVVGSRNDATQQDRIFLSPFIKSLRNRSQSSTLAAAKPSKVVASGERQTVHLPEKRSAESDLFEDIEPQYPRTKTARHDLGSSSYMYSDEGYDHRNVLQDHTPEEDEFVDASIGQQHVSRGSRQEVASQSSEEQSKDGHSDEDNPFLLEEEEEVHVEERVEDNSAEIQRANRPRVRSPLRSSLTSRRLSRNTGSPRTLSVATGTSRGLSGSSIGLTATPPLSGGTWTVEDWARLTELLSPYLEEYCQNLFQLPKLPRFVYDKFSGFSEEEVQRRALAVARQQTVYSSKSLLRECRHG